MEFAAGNELSPPSTHRPNPGFKAHFNNAYISPTEKEKAVRTWISQKESVCPYAPGLARFIHLPKIDALSMEHVYYLAQELQAFYDAKEKGKRVGRWMLMPCEEWTSHKEAHHYSERLFWLLNAAYYHLKKDKKSVRASLNQKLEGYNRGYKGDILNPIIGKLPDPKSDTVPPKSLFYSALSPLYNSKRFYRYSPHSLIPLVYASEFHELKLKHPSVTEKVAFEMAYGGLFEVFGDDLELDLTQFRKELPAWDSIIDRVAEIMRAASMGLSSRSREVKGCPESNLSYFRLSNPKLVDAFFNKYGCKLNILDKLVHETGVEPKEIISACFAGSGLYTVPNYPLETK